MLTRARANSDRSFGPVKNPLAQLGDPVSENNSLIGGNSVCYY